MLTGAKTMKFEDALASGIVSYIPEEVADRFIDNVLAQQVNPGVCEKAGLKLVYSPLNGAATSRCAACSPRSARGT